MGRRTTEGKRERLLVGEEKLYRPAVECSGVGVSFAQRVPVDEKGVAEAVGMTMMTTMSETVIKKCSDVHYVWIHVDM